MVKNKHCTRLLENTHVPVCLLIQYPHNCPLIKTHLRDKIKTLLSSNTHKNHSKRTKHLGHLPQIIIREKSLKGFFLIVGQISSSSSSSIQPGWFILLWSQDKSLNSSEMIDFYLVSWSSDGCVVSLQCCILSLKRTVCRVLFYVLLTSPSLPDSLGFKTFSPDWTQPWVVIIRANRSKPFCNNKRKSVFLLDKSR